MTRLLTLKQNNTRAGRIRYHTIAQTDILVIPEVVARNRQKLTEFKPRKRRRDYAKKILNDPFIMSA